MRIRVLSDLHLEFGAIELPPAQADVVVLAGDIGLGDRGLEWGRKTFLGVPVLYVPGNHEYYGNALPRLLDLLKTGSGFDVRVLDGEEFRMGDVTFLGCTLWTDFRLDGDPRAAMLAAARGMTDYRRIRVSPTYRKLRPQDTAGLHRKARGWLETRLREGHGRKTVVVTHHAPSQRSLDSVDGDGREEGDGRLAPAYASNLEALIEETAPALWIHGHHHRKRDFRIGETRVIANPRGYPGEVSGFEPGLVVEV
jgi:predicted phosphodiesterase